MYRPAEFYRPPPCPVFEPTEEEFADPLKFISSIRAEGEKHGIVKIRPPSSFQPPFALDVEDFKFRPRRQRINELSACTRIRTNFLEKVSKFWEHQGINLRIPRVENEILCLYTLHRAVQNMGGFTQCCEGKKWGELAQQLGYTSKAGAGSALRLHYKNLLYPFDVLTQHLKPEADHPCRRSISNKASIIRSQKNGRMGRMMGIVKEPKAETGVKRPTEQELAENKELKRLKLVGPGPKMAGLGVLPNSLEDGPVRRSRRNDLKSPSKTSPAKKQNDVKLKCVKCKSQHNFAEILPKIFEVPKGDWHCPDCMRKLAATFTESEQFGFESSDRVYTLREFGERADEFKRDYFNLPPFEVKLDTVEREFWRICEDLEEEVTVEYGADIQAMTSGSGFSSRFNPPSSIDDPVYKAHPWNLVNLPVASKSVLQYIEGDISGVKVPWLYVGMCFSAFAWHTEDHWTYSINYHHWGEPKIWYGAPRSEAAKLEKVFRKEAGELFNNQRDLMHHITTTISPGVLKRDNVQLCTAIQNPGEFIVTFPRGYHAGFNAGLNLCEAVNFCPPDWFPIGREALDNYRKVQRYNIFSQDELTIRVAKLATSGFQVESSIVTGAHEDLSNMIEREKADQDKIMELGKCKISKCKIEKDQYCGVCQTSVFCSYCYTVKSVVLDEEEKYEVPEGFVDQGIEIGSDRVLCNQCAIERLKENDPLVKDMVLMLHCDIESLIQLRDNMRNNTKDFTNWLNDIKSLKNDSKSTIKSYQEILTQGQRYEITREYQELRSIIADAEKFELYISEIFVDGSRPCLSKKELDTLCSKVAKLPFQLKNANLLLDEHKLVSRMLEKLQDKDLSTSVCDELVEQEKRLKIEITDMVVIADLQKVLDIMPKLRGKHASIDAAADVLEMGSELAGMEYNSSIFSEYQKLESDVDLARRYESKAVQLLDSVENEDEISMTTIRDFEDNVRDVSSRIKLPNCSQVQDELCELNLWRSSYSRLIEADPNQSQTEPPLSQAKSLLKKADSLKFGHLCEEVQSLRDRVEKAESWVDKLAKVFLKRSQFYWSLREVLLPRTDEMIKVSHKELKEIQKRKKKDEGEIAEEGPRLTGEKISHLEERELTLMKQLKSENDKKLSEPDAKFCICQRVAKSTMYRCELCHEWLHSLCLPKRSEICCKCMRSRRPPLSSVIPLLVELQDQKLHIQEGDSLQALVERVVRWQNDYKMAMQKLRNNDDSQDDQLLQEITSLYVESLLLEVHLEESNYLKQEMKSRWPKLGEVEPPEGAELADEKASQTAKDKRKRPEVKTDRVKRQRKPKPTLQDASSSSDPDDEGPCAASNCKYPFDSGEVVQWVCCDKCSRWFHCACVGLSFKEARAEKEYACLQCQQLITSSST